MKNTILLIITILLFVGYATYQHLDKPKTAYVELQKVFDGFEMTKEMSVDIEKVQKVREMQLDTIGVRIEMFKRMLNTQYNPALVDSIKRKEYEYYLKKQSYDDDMATLTTTYNDKIWKQLNQYISDYGRENKFDYLHGAAGNGSIMYADSSHNVTNEVIAYVNDKYSGK
ncbi:MAG: OmpH family outer membrane protein [Sphingobacteriales bacterium JAD_PAG50586_3]|nr:MAG: OmpH family outer membrane protein [Sphingobacteriales bacterium JAD_PAG50586_3]